MSTPSQHEIVNQESFVETPYHDAEWEVVGAPPSEQTFAPQKLEVVKSNEFALDPVFADYGGFGSQKGKVTRWHLPEDLAAKAIGQKESSEERIENMVMEHAHALEVMEKRAFEQGKAAAKKELEEKLKSEAAALGSRVGALIADLQRQNQESHEVIERQAVELAVRIAGELMRSAVEFNPEYIVPIVKEGLAQAGGATIKSVRVSPEDHEFLSLAGALSGIEGAGTQFQFVADGSVRSGCVLETTSGEIDLQLEAAFERIRSQVVRATR